MKIEFHKNFHNVLYEFQYSNKKKSAKDVGKLFLHELEKKLNMNKLKGKIINIIL